MPKQQRPLRNAQRAGRGLRRAVFLLSNWLRSRSQDLDYIQITLPSSMPALPQQRGFIQQRIFGRTPMSLYDLERIFERIGHDPRPRGVVLFLRGFSMSLADLETLRASMHRLRRSGKRVICYAQSYDLSSYFVATAADEILLQPGGSLLTTGLVQQQIYLRDGLDAAGLQSDVVAISPYKTAGDLVSRTEPSPEGRAMTDWLLDSTYDIIVDAIAAGRSITRDAAREMIDSSPHIDQNAVERGYVDTCINEEKLRQYLGTQHVVLWEQADGMIRHLWQRPSQKYVAILPLSGLIVPGESQQPPAEVPLPLVGSPRLGDITAVQQIRNLMQDNDAAAVVAFVDSPGGSSDAAEAITSALDELAKDRPVVVYMNGVAASGGYYISTAADWIIAQRGTVTGSIGVLSVKLVANETLRKLRLNPIYYFRGRNASMFAPAGPLTEGQREHMRVMISRVYDLFVERVGAARKMKPESVDEVAGGRVWTGAQAFENGLVDELGGLYEAIRKARELANLPSDAPVRITRSKGKALPAQVSEQMDPAAGPRYWYGSVNAFANGTTQMLLPFDWQPFNNKP